MKVLLSIKPEFAFKIFDGTKLFEFRKAIFKHPEIKTVIVYASSPIQRVIGEFEIADILSNNPTKIWQLTRKHSGISEDFFFEYFADKDIAYAIKIKSTVMYDTPLNIREEFNMLPPQSYAYIND